MQRIVVLISGSGSNLQAIIDACSVDAKLNAHVVAVISNQSSAFGLQRANNSGIPAVCIDHRLFANRQDFDQSLAEKINSYQPDLVVLAGFMRILTAEFTRHFAGKLLNIHPSLLPKYPGLNTHQRAIDAGDTYAGATVHFVTAELDGGPSILQSKIAINDCNVDQLSTKVMAKEHLIYPLVIKWFAANRLKLRDNQAFLDGSALPLSGIQYEQLE